MEPQLAMLVQLLLVPDHDISKLNDHSDMSSTVATYDPTTGLTHASLTTSRGGGGGDAGGGEEISP